MNVWLPNSPLGGLPIIKNARSKRESSYDKSGGNRDFWQVKEGETAVIADIQSPGCIKSIWMTIRCYDEMYLRKVSLEMYWDGEENPSVRVPIGDFFGVGFAAANHYITLPMTITFGDRRGPKGPFSGSMNCFLPMPFGKSARIQVVNEADMPLENLFFYVNYEEYTDPILDNVGYFHACYNHENPCKKIVHDPNIDLNNPPHPAELPGVNLTGEDNYVALEAEGRGHFVGVLLNIDNIDVSNQPYPWPGEGDDMIFIDGEKWPPSLHGTGTEDYFCCSWGFPSGEYSAPYHAITLGADKQEHFGKWSLLRWHIEDPIRFQKSIRHTFEHGHANDQSNEYSSVAYWYQLEPHKPLPSLEPVQNRLVRRWPEHGTWDK